MGKKTRATQEALGALHLATAEYFKRMLEDAEEQGVSVPAAQMANILRFLHDNDIVAVSDTQNILEDMRNKLSKQKQAALNVSKDDLSGQLPVQVDYEQMLHDIEVEGEG